MNLEFTTPLDEEQGTIAALLCRCYADLLVSDPLHWKPEQGTWEQYDHAVYSHPETVGACIFLSRINGMIVGFGSWDSRQKPRYGIVGHNGILPEFRGKGYGKRQLREILRRFRKMGIQTAGVTTLDHPFFIPAQRMYTACGFVEMRRMPWDRNPELKRIEYEKEIGQTMP